MTGPNVRSFLVQTASAASGKSVALALTWVRPWLLVLLAAVIFQPRFAEAQCGPSVTGHFGGETSAVAQVNASTLMVARGTEVEMFSLANPSAPAPYSPRRTMGLEAPAVKISMTQGSSKAFVLLANGDVKVLTIAGSSFVATGFQTVMNTHYAVDIVADGQRVYIAILDEDPYVPSVNYTSLLEYDVTSGSPQFVWSESPLNANYGFDRLAIVNNILWAGFHEFQSVILGVDDGHRLARIELAMHRDRPRRRAGNRSRGVPGRHRPSPGRPRHDRDRRGEDGVLLQAVTVPAGRAGGIGRRNVPSRTPRTGGFRQ